MVVRLSPSFREGSDVREQEAPNTTAISIHAPREGSDGSRIATDIDFLISIHAPVTGATAKITKTIPNDLRKINNYNNSFTQICAKHNCKFDIR